MLINEIVKPSANSLTEGMMKYPEWRKDKYANPFIEMILGGEEEPINYIKDGVESQGVLKSTPENKKMAEYMQNVLNQGGDTKDLAIVSFTVEVLDEDDNPTGTLEEVKIQEIIKDERVTGQLRVNLGNIAELVLGCAVTAKYEKQKEDITSEDVIDMAIRLSKGNGQVVSDAGKDNIVFQASVPSADKKAFAAFVGEDPKGRTLADFGVKPEVVRGINNHIKSAVAYVNTSPRVLLAVDKAAADPGQNEIEVISDGGNAEQQKTTKVDLKIMIDGTRLNLLSIKAGSVGQFGQVSGYEFDKLNGFFEQSLNMSLSPKVAKSFQKFDLSLKGKERNANRTAVREANYSTAFNAAYDEVEKKLRALSKGDQLDLLERVYNGLLYHATRNEEGVEMVILTPNAKTAFSELTFGPELREALDDYQLVVHRGQSAKMHIIQVYGYPKTEKAKKAMGTNKEMLVQYRSYAQANAVRNIIEMGNLLKELADWEKIEQRRGQKPAGAATPIAPAKLAQKSQPIQPVAQPEPAVSMHQPEVEPMGMTGNNVTTLQNNEFKQPPDELAAIRKNAGLKV